MSNEGGFIHINEAVKVYERTRQSFYNYINKGQIETKKVNNKLYLNIKDIETLLSPYIGQIVENISEQDDITVELQKIEDTTEATNSAIIELKQEIEAQLMQFATNLRIETNNTLYHFKEQLEHSHAQLLEDQLSKFAQPTENPLTILRIKKYQFYLGYIGFVAINIIIFGILY